MCCHARTQILTGSEQGNLLNQTSALEKGREQTPLFLGLTAQSVLISRNGTKRWDAPDGFGKLFGVVQNIVPELERNEMGNGGGAAYRLSISRSEVSGVLVLSMPLVRPRSHTL